MPPVDGRDEPFLLITVVDNPAFAALPSSAVPFTELNSISPFSALPVKLVRISVRFSVVH